MKLEGNTSLLELFSFNHAEIDSIKKNVLKILNPFFNIRTTMTNLMCYYLIGCYKIWEKIM